MEVTNQITGNRFVLRSPQTVTHITQNLSTHKVVRSRLANASDRSVYQLVFLDQRGNEREMLYLQSCRLHSPRQPVYYDSSSSLCFNYLSDLESALFGTAVSASQCDDKPAPWELEHNPF